MSALILRRDKNLGRPWAVIRRLSKNGRVDWRTMGKTNTSGIVFLGALSGRGRHVSGLVRGLACSLAVGVFLCAAVVCSAQDPRFIGGAGITVFADSNFRGTTQTFQSDVSDLRSSGLDNRISSLRIGPGEQWEVCENRNYGGRCIVVSGQESNLQNNGWGDRISSIRRNSGGGGGGQRPPSWAQGTFYARNPQTGGTLQMTVQNNGQVTFIQDGGTTTYGSMNGTILTNGPYRARISQINNGIRTTSTTNSRDRIDYSRNNPGPGWGGGGGGNVPSWALGTFYARNPQTGGTIQMTIQNNGQVMLIQDGSTTTYASLNGTILTNGPYQARISQIRNGIRTTNTSNSRDRIDYTRNRTW